MRFVELKAQEQLDVQSLHRVRSQLARARTALINQLRAILLERGTIIPQGRRRFEKALEALLADAGFIAGNRVRRLLLELREEWIDLDRRIDALDQKFLALARKDSSTRRLASIPGIGALNAIALVAAAGDASRFDKARDLGAGLGRCCRTPFSEGFTLRIHWAKGRV